MKRLLILRVVFPLLCIRDCNRFLQKNSSSVLKLGPRNSILDSRKHRVSRIEFRVETVNLHLTGTVLSLTENCKTDPC